MYGIMGPGKMGQWFISKIPLDKDIDIEVIIQGGQGRS
jgi:hypothetical protein